MNIGTMLAALAAVPMLGLALWGFRRRGRAAAAIAPGDAVAARTPATPPASAAAVLGTGDASEPHASMHALYAIAFDRTPQDAAGSGIAGHAAVVAGAVAILSRLEAQPRYAPRRPRLLPQLMQAVNDPEASLRGIGRIIGQDPALAAQLLRIANSASYRVQSAPVESIDRALALVGTDGIRPMIAAALVQPVMAVGEGVFGRLPGLVWDHTLAAAVAAAGFATGVGHDDAFAAQLLALLHGLGAIVVVQVVRDEYAARPGLVPAPAVVAALLDGWAATTARRIAGSWELSGRITHALGEQMEHAVPAGASPLGRALQCGRLLAALSELCRLGRLDEAVARARVATLDGCGEASAEIWQRLRRNAQAPEPARCIG